MANNQAMVNNNQAGPSQPREPSLKEQKIEQHLQEHGDPTGCGSLLLLVVQAKAEAEEEKQAANAELQDRLDEQESRDRLKKKKRKNGEGEIEEGETACFDTDGEQQAQEAEEAQEVARRKEVRHLWPRVS